MQLLDAAMPELKKNIQAGVDFVNKSQCSYCQINYKNTNFTLLSEGKVGFQFNAIQISSFEFINNFI